MGQITREEARERIAGGEFSEELRPFMTDEEASDMLYQEQEEAENRRFEEQERLEREAQLAREKQEKEEEEEEKRLEEEKEAEEQLEEEWRNSQVFDDKPQSPRSRRLPDGRVQYNEVDNDFNFDEMDDDGMDFS